MYMMQSNILLYNMLQRLGDRKLECILSIHKKCVGISDLASYAKAEKK